MGLHPETYSVINKIKQESKLTDNALSLLGITPDKVSAAIESCLRTGMTRQAAIKTIIGLWTKSNPDTQPTATDKEMKLLGFELINKVWVHTKYNVHITIEQQATLTFREIENTVIKAMEGV